MAPSVLLLPQCGLDYLICRCPKIQSKGFPMLRPTGTPDLKTRSSHRFATREMLVQYQVTSSMNKACPVNADGCFFLSFSLGFCPPSQFLDASQASIRARRSFWKILAKVLPSNPTGVETFVEQGIVGKRPRLQGGGRWLDE